ncbi:WYL domain-containing protein, partial [Micromonospora sp. NPDC000018]
TGRATVLAAPGRAAGLRRWAVGVTAGPDGDRLVLPYADVDVLAGQLVGYGPDVRVLDPPEVREAVIQRLKEIAARHDDLAAVGGAR